MKKRILPAPLLYSLLWVPGAIALAPHARAQNAADGAAAMQTMPETAYVLAVRGDVITLSAGADRGARVGAIYQIARDNSAVRLQLTEVRAADSTARIVAAETGGQSLLITVGDTATLLAIAPETATPTAPAPPPTAPPPTAPPPTAPPTVPAPTAPLPPEPPDLTVAPGDGATPPPQVLVTQVEGRDIMLGAGSNMGVVLGAVYVMPATGAQQARMIVVEVSGSSSRARLLRIDDDFVPVVGENARFDGIETVPAELLTPAPIVIEPTQPTVIVPDAPNGGVPVAPTLKMATTRPTEISGTAASIIDVNGQTVTLSAGTQQGARAGQNVPILRDGAVIGLVRIESAGPDTSLATIVYSDAGAGALRVGDAAGLLSPGSGIGAPITIPALGIPNQPIPSVRVRYESGASNIVVPKADATYELLASLASRELIKSQPARVFQDDGARRHRVAEDITFSRAQIAGFITEAISNFDGEKGRDAAALAILVKQYRRDLRDLNVPETTLDALGAQGFAFGISNWTRARVVGGDNGDDSRNPNDERFGAGRRKTGLDTRTNIFGTITPKLSFYASGDAGTDVRNGEPFGEVASNSFRKAYLDYDAGSLLRGLSIRVGRQEIWWGPGHFGTGLISDAAGGLDSLTTSFRRGSYELRGLYARLGTGPAGGSRALYAQDANVRIGKNVKIGLNTALLTPKDDFDLTNFATAFTPIPLYEVRSDSGLTNANTNIIVSGYGEAAVARGARVYGEVILDDLGTTATNPIENRAGAIFGIKYHNANDPAKLGINFEYARLGSVSYTFFAGRPAFDADYNYYYRGAPLGYSIAPFPPTVFGGAENLRADGYYRALPKLTLFGSIQFSDLNSQDQNVPGEPGFMRQRIYRAAATYDLTRRFVLTARAQRVETDQPNFVSGGNRNDTLFSLEIGRSF